MAEMAVTVAAANGTLRTCSGVSPTAPGGRRAAVLGQWRPLAPANLRLSSPAVRLPRATFPAAVEDWSNTDIVPIPKVIIDQDSDPDATIVEITLGDRLGDLLDTMNALKNLGLNVVKASVCLDSTGKHNKFSITKASTGRKIDDPELLEAIRLTIINNMIVYHPESSSQLAMGATFGPIAPTEEVLPKLCQRLASSKCLTSELKTSQFSMEIHETILFVYIYHEKELAHNVVQNTHFFSVSKLAVYFLFVSASLQNLIASNFLIWDRPIAGSVYSKTDLIVFPWYNSDQIVVKYSVRIMCLFWRHENLH